MNWGKKTEVLAKEPLKAFVMQVFTKSNAVIEIPGSGVMTNARGELWISYGESCIALFPTGEWQLVKLKIPADEKPAPRGPTGESNP